MKNTYIVERMTIANLCNYMSGSNNYSVETLYIEAESVEEAIEKASADGYEVNKNYVKTVAEIEAERAALEVARAEAAAKEAAKKARREANEARKAAEAGLTVEGYRAMKKREAKKRAIARDIVAMEEHIERLKADIAYERERLAKLEAEG